MLIHNDAPVKGWIAGSNSLWLAAARHCRERSDRWLWLEPDAIPLCADWLDRIDRQCFDPHAFYGHIYAVDQPNLPKRMLSGIAVYPADAIEIVEPQIALRPTLAFDVAAAGAIMERAKPTGLIQHVWGQPGDPPRFRRTRIPNSSQFGLDDISRESVIFHRNKDGSLIHLLREKLFQESNPQAMEVVMSFCAKDASLARRNLEWQAQLSQQQSNTIVLQCEQTLPEATVARVSNYARMSYASVTVNKIRNAPNPNWPHGPNWSFMRAVELMGIRRKPWLWLEPDAIPVTEQWLQRLEREYHDAQKPFMGTLIGGMGHMNGVAVYPADVLAYAPSLRNLNTAFDVAMQREIVPHHVHKANHLIQHCRHFDKSQCFDTHGQPPVFRTRTDLAALGPEVVLFHPDKAGSLIPYLKSAA